MGIFPSVPPENGNSEEFVQAVLDTISTWKRCKSCDYLLDYAAGFLKDAARLVREENDQKSLRLKNN